MDKQFKVVNCCLETYLRCFLRGQAQGLTRLVGMGIYWFNMTYNSSSKMAPFKALYGRYRPVLFCGETYPSKGAEVQQLTVKSDRTSVDHQHNLRVAQQKMGQSADKNRRDVTYKVDDWVYLKVQPYRLRPLAKRWNEKLSPQFFGPYLIKERIGEVAYHQDLPSSCHPHPVFPLGLLKKAVPPSYTPQPIPSVMTD